MLLVNSCTYNNYRMPANLVRVAFPGTNMPRVITRLSHPYALVRPRRDLMDTTGAGRKFLSILCKECR